MLGNKEFVFTLLYRATQQEYTAEEFHRKCDHRSPTVSLLKLNNGNCIGGFTSSRWQTPSSQFLGQYYMDHSALLFNLTDEISYPVKNADKAIYCFRNTGPCFGDEELFVEKKSNEEGQCKSFANQIGYNIQTKN